jgi:Fic family protein
MRSRGTRSALPRRRSSSSGKPLKDHLDHYEAIRYVRALARLGTPLTEADLRQLYLLMILILIRGGYPPVAVRPEDRPAYVGALQEAQAGRGSGRFDRLLYERLDTTLGEYLSAAKEVHPAPPEPKK